VRHHGEEKEEEKTEEPYLHMVFVPLSFEILMQWAYCGENTTGKLLWNLKTFTPLPQLVL
jgi:hypothetical protein